MDGQEYSFGAIISLWQEFDLSLLWTEDGVVSQMGPMISALCGQLTALEFPLAIEAVRQEVVWRYPWLTRLDTLRLPDWMLSKPSHVWEWAWLDKQEQRFGSSYRMAPLPEDWRRFVKVTTFHARAFQRDGTSFSVGFWDLPAEYRAHLGGLGYDTTP